MTFNVVTWSLFLTKNISCWIDREIQWSMIKANSYMEAIWKVKFFMFNDRIQVISMLVTNVRDRCWRRFMLVKTLRFWLRCCRFLTLKKSPTSWDCHQLKVTNITVGLNSQYIFRHHQRKSKRKRRHYRLYVARRTKQYQFFPSSKSEYLNHILCNIDYA